MSDKPSGLGGWLGAAAVIALVLLLGKVLPGLAKLLLWGIGILAVLFVAVLAVSIWLASRKPKQQPAEVDSLAEARRLHLAITQKTNRLRDPELRALSREAGAGAERILVQLKEQPEEIRRIRQFSNYYLPTLDKILGQYLRLESSGMAGKETKQSLARCLGDIHSAFRKMHENLFADDILDLTAEMQTLTVIAHRDGLLADAMDPGDKA